MKHIRTMWNGLQPYQREATWTGLFGLAAIALFAVALVLAALLCPAALIGDGFGVAIVMGGVVGLAGSLGGMLLGYRIEDRRTRPVRALRTEKPRRLTEVRAILDHLGAIDETPRKRP